MKRTTFTTVLLCLVSIAFAQGKEVCGTVRDDEGGVLTNVSIHIKGIAIGTVTDTVGKYCISIPDNIRKPILVFSFAGMETEEIKVNNSTVINVILKDAGLYLDDLEDEIQLMDKGYLSKSKSISSMEYLSKSISNMEYVNEEYSKINENEFKPALKSPLSTFSIDVDKASYANVRRYLNQGENPPADAVRVEEMINYFDYDYPAPKGEHPFEIYTELGECPWQKRHQLLHIGIQGKKIPTDNLPPSNLVFLLDVSGSMSHFNKLPLLKKSLKILVDNLRAEDKVSIVVYAGAAGCVLEPTAGDQKHKIKEALDKLEAGGSTAGGAGIMLAYKKAKENFMPNGNNRIILATDGDFNIGISNNNQLEDLIVKERESGVFLTVLGFGMGNYKDAKVEILADKGNGNYAYIDNMQEASKVLVTEFGGTLYTIAKDVKIQVEFNPTKVQAYRLVGYENRKLNDEDFKDDTKDAGELGAGHTVTALYEIIPIGEESEFVKETDKLKYQNVRLTTSKEFATIKFRYKNPDGGKSIEMIKTIDSQITPLAKTSDNFRFSSSVAMSGMLLRKSKFKQGASYELVITTAQDAKGDDKEGYKAEFIRLMKTLK